MINYIESVCVGKPLDLPSYDEDSELWEVYFEESETPWNPSAERDIIPYICESADEACEVYNHYNKHPAGEKTDETTTQEN
tara:strand:+ start:50 stop:292 length:243 start_codon:yes stop_codon:yes gene_type:complete